MNVDFKQFERLYGKSVPDVLARFYKNVLVRKGGPLRFELPERGWVIEVQYFLNLDEQNNVDVEHSRFAFAVNSDGHEMLIDLSNENLPILQREYDDLDTINVTVGELLRSSIMPLL